MMDYFDHGDREYGIVGCALASLDDPVERGATWTTDAPYREPLEAVGAARAEGILAVEMEAAALYAFGEARRKSSVLCFAHVTNQMGQSGDFEKGLANGATASLAQSERLPLPPGPNFRLPAARSATTRQSNYA
jgi:hypothetical protein